MGLSPDVFWKMTPWQFSVCMEAFEKKRDAERDYDLSIAWHIAAFGRAKKLPSLKEIIRKPKKGIDETEILARLKAYNKRLENE